MLLLLLRVDVVRYDGTFLHSYWKFFAIGLDWSLVIKSWAGSHRKSFISPRCSCLLPIPLACTTSVSSVPCLFKCLAKCLLNVKLYIWFHHLAMSFTVDIKHTNLAPYVYIQGVNVQETQGSWHHPCDTTLVTDSCGKDMFGSETTYCDRIQCCCYCYCVNVQYIVTIAKVYFIKLYFLSGWCIFTSFRFLQISLI